VAAATLDPDKALSWEKRHRPRAAIAALVGSLALLVFYISGEVLERDAPLTSGLDTLVRAVQPGPVETLPALRAAEFEYLDSKLFLVYSIGIGGLIGFIGLAWAVGFLAVATRARMDNFRRFLVYLPIVGGVLVGVSILLGQFGIAALVRDFLDGPRTVLEATRQETSLRLFAGILYQVGSLVLAVGIVLVSLNAMRVGLLTKLFGYIGIVAGALLVMIPLPVVQVFWLGGIGFLFLGRWPGGDLPAWRTGEAVPWPVPAGRVPPPARAAKPAREPAASPPVRSSGRSKRKKRH